MLKDCPVETIKELDCPLDSTTMERKQKMKQAFAIFHDEMKIISFYESQKEGADILVGCSEDYIEEDVWLRQLLKIQFPNPLPQKAQSQYPGFNLLAFQATLEIIKECDGISKDEGFLINTVKSMSEINMAIDSIKSYRNGLEGIRNKGRDEISKFTIEQQCAQVKVLYSKEIAERLSLLKKFYNSKSQKEDAIRVEADKRVRTKYGQDVKFGQVNGKKGWYRGTTLIVPWAN